MAPRARFELATLRLTAAGCKTLNALFGVAYDPEHLKSRPSVGQLLGNLLSRSVDARPSTGGFIDSSAEGVVFEAIYFQPSQPLEADSK
jgi:hypothetical protein